MRVIYLDRSQLMNRKVAGLPGVQREVMEAALEIGVKAEALLAPHTKTGAAHIEVDDFFPAKYGSYDATVWLVDNKNALAIETDHRHNFSRELVQGLHVLGRAAGLF